MDVDDTMLNPSVSSFSDTEPVLEASHEGRPDPHFNDETSQSFRPISLPVRNAHPVNPDREVVLLLIAI